nr:hypothetical protein [Tanacetum cinerariifolium]
MVAYLTKSDASEGFTQIIDFLNGSYIKYALTMNLNIYVSCIKQFWTTVAIKQVNNVPRLQALVYKKKVVVTEAAIREVLCLDDAEGVDYLPNEEIFTELARMGYKKPSTKLTFYKAFFSSQWKFLIHTILQSISAKQTSWNEFSSLMASAVICLSTGGLSIHTTKYTSPTLTQKVFENIRRVGKGFSGVETPLFKGMLVGQEIEEEGNEDEHVEDVTTGDDAQGNDTAAHGEVPTVTQEPSIPSLTPPSPPPQPPQDLPSTSQVQHTPPQSPQVQPQPQPQQAANFPMSLLQEALDACAALTRRVEHLEYDKVAQALEITNLKRRVKKLEKRNKVRVLKLRRLQRVGTLQRVDTSDDTVMDDESNQGRMIAEIDKDDAVVLMDEKEEDKKVEEAKVVEILAATLTAAPVRVIAAPSRRRKGVVIRDPKEESTTSTIIPAETKSKDKGKGILVEEPKPLKKKQQIEMDEEYARKLHVELNKDIDWDVAIDHVKLKAKDDPAVKRYQAMKKKPQTKAQARKNMMMYFKNVAGFKLDYFKGMSYDDIRPIFEAKFNSNVDFLLKTKEQMEEEESRALQTINETLAEKVAKRRKLNEEVEDLKRHLEIVPDEDDDVYTKATPLARKELQDSPDDEEDTRSSHEYLNDLEEEYQARSILAKSKRFFKKGTQRFSSAKATDQTECHKCGKKGHFARDCWSKTSVPSYQSPFQLKSLSSSQYKPKLRPTKDVEAKYNKVKAKLALLSSSASASKAFMVKNKGLIAKAYEWDEKEVSSDDNEMVEVKVLMALAKDNDAISVKGAKNGEWVKISMRKVHTLLEMEDNDNRKTDLGSNKVNQCISEQISSQKKRVLGVDQLTKDASSSRQKDLVFVKSLVDDTKVSIPAVERPWLSKAEGFILPNHDTGRILPAESQRNTIDPSVVVTDFSTTEYDLANESLVYSTPLPPLKKLNGHEPTSRPKTIKLILRSKSTFKAKTLKGAIINEPSSASVKGNKNSSATILNSASVGEALQAKKTEALKSTRAESSNANRSKTPTKRVFNTRRQQTKEIYHITFDESPDAIKFSKPAIDNINIAETKRYPSNEYLHPYEPSQPDIQFFTCLCARYQANHKESYLIDVKRIFRKSTSCACQLLGGKLVCWSAKKQQFVAMSSPKAKYVVVAGFCANILWMKSQLADYDIIYEKETKSSSPKDKSLSHPSPPTPLVGKMHKEAQQAAGGPTSLGATGEEGAHSQLSSGMDEGNKNYSFDHIFTRANHISLKVNLEDLSDILKDTRSTFFTPDSPPDEPIIILDESEEEDEVTKDKDTAATSHDVPKHTSVLPPTALKSAKIQELMAQVHLIESQKEELEQAKAKAKAKAKAERKKHVRDMEIEPPRDLKEILTKLVTFTSTISSLPSQVAELKNIQWELPTEVLNLPSQVSLVQEKLKTLDSLLSLLYKVTDTLNRFATMVENALGATSMNVPLAGKAIASLAEGEKNTKDADINLKDKLVDLLGKNVVTQYYT